MMNNIKKYLKIFILWLTGGFSYFFLEILFRGRSHWTMFILGAICFILIGLINEILPWKTPIELQALLGAGCITICEFITGCIVNLYLNWNIWDYSNMPFNILGQICLPFTILWFFISILAIVLDDWIRYIMFDEEKPHYISIFRKR